MSAKLDANGASQSQRKGRKRKEKKQKIEISLWINQTKYEYGLLCTFCTKIPAVCHCPECPDFYCGSCDATAHKTKKRQGHVRTVLSKLDLFTAASLVTRAVRRYGHIRLIQERCRQIFTRHFDRHTLNYYYYNPVYDSVSWRKPYCLRKLEFAPYMEPPYAASKMQNLYHLWRAREKTRERLLSQYSKIFDRKSGYFYYAYNGPSRLLPRQNWDKPKFLGKRSFPKDILPIYTKDVACIIIQRKWRAILVWQFLRALARASHDEIWDPVKGRYNYYHRDAEVLHQLKPKLLRNEAWDPNRVHDWNLERVSLFLRRIGLKQYVQTFYNYGVDGRGLILLDEEDYENLYVTNRVHIRKIQVEIKRIYFYDGPPIRMSDDHAARREKIRRQKMYHAAAVMAQKHFRIFSAKCKVAVIREVRRIKREEEALAAHIAATNTWYTLKDDLPIKKPSIAAGWTEKNEIRLPPIKSFGRYRDYLGHQGWGHKQIPIEEIADASTDPFKQRDVFDREHSGGGAGSAAGGGSNQLAVAATGSRMSKGSKAGLETWSPTKAAVLDKEFNGDTHATRAYTDRLHINGYDAKRMQRFMDMQVHLNGT
mmetsp:Transcript_17064/g.28887  ORF Transcript_17064/g.28887 Transcript_17064/m.28887 type:complete len:595 (-) Transcript_17064:297-2081(-)